MAENTQLGEVTPILYNFYGNQYNYNDLALAADAGLNEYLATLKRGEKDSNDFRTAYANIMSGIKDGSITFDNGQFRDSQGRYTNSDKKNRDYYGLVANYIFSKMGKSGLYKKPEETPWDALTNVRKALMQELFNSDTGNIQDFLDLDAEKDGVRAITNRSARLASAFQTLADNWDSRFTGYSDNDRTKYKLLLGEAATALRDGTIDPGDYLALSKAVGGIDFRTMLYSGKPTLQQVVLLTGSSQTNPLTLKLRSASLVDNEYNSDTVDYLSSIMSRVKTNGLVNILRNSFYNRNYRFARDPRVYSILKSSKISSKVGVTAVLNALQKQGKLRPADPENPSLFYIPGLRTKRGTAWVWDRNNNKVSEVSILNIPYLKLHIQMNKKGGVLYAGGGALAPYWYSGLNDFTGTYNREYDEALKGLNDKGEYTDPFTTRGKGYGANMYLTDSNYSDYSDKGKTYAQSVEDTDEFKRQTENILADAKKWYEAKDRSSILGKDNAFVRYMDAYDKGVGTDSGASFRDASGQLRSSWTGTGKDSYGRPVKNTVTDLYLRIRDLRSDLLLSLGHNNVTRNGKRYYYMDNNKVKHWVDPEVIKSNKYKLGEGKTNIEGDTTWTDYELTGLNDSNLNGTLNGNESKINPTQQENKPSWWDKNKQEILDNVLPLGAEATRLGLSLRTNKKIADIQKAAIKPVLKNTYELYSPVTGAFSEMQLRNRQAAEVRRQAALPYTSDASLNAARSLDANRQATDLEYQGFLADDKEIQRTKAEALKRQEDNIARRTDVANFNRASINQANKEIADIESQRLNANHQGVDNFIANNIVTPLKEKAAYNLGQRRLDEYNKKLSQANYDMAPITRLQEYQKQQLTNYYTNKEREIYRKYQADFARLLKEHADDEYYNIQTSPEYLKYEKEIIALRNQQLRDAFDMSNYFDTQNRDVYNHIYDNLRSGTYNSKPFTTTVSPSVMLLNWYKIINGVQSAKRGGRLSLSTQYLLNKVIK